MNEDTEAYEDVVGQTLANRGDIMLDTKFLKASIRREESTGVRTLAWNDEVCLVAGTDDGENKVTVAQMLTPEKAREVGETLLQAADEAEERQQQAAEYEYDQEDEKSFLRRLIS
jgi:hypothetical protein